MDFPDIKTAFNTVDIGRALDLLAFVAAAVADLFKDHRDCNLEKQPGGEENRQKERGGKCE